MLRTYNHRNRSNTSRNKTYATTLQQQQQEQEQEQQHIRSVSCHTAELLPSSAQDLAATLDPRPFADDHHRRRNHPRPPPPRVVVAATTVSTSILHHALAVLNQQAREDALCFLTNLDKSKKEKDTVDQAAIDDVMHLWSTEHRVVDEETANVFGDHTELQIFPALL